MYEVKNTFGEQHTYIFKTKDNNLIKNHCDKKFHVSPFMDLNSTYNFKILKPGNKLSVIIDQEIVRESYYLHLKMAKKLS